MDNKKSIKKWTSYQDQIDILKSRGMTIDDESRAIKYLQNINYYRLSGYSFIFRYKDDNDKHRFKENTHFEDIKELYVFDKKLRLLILDAIETIEVSLKANIAYVIGQTNSKVPFDTSVFKLNNRKNIVKYSEIINTVNTQLIRSKDEEFISHHDKNYKDIPVWALLEIFTMGNISNLYTILKPEYAKQISEIYGIKNPYIFYRILYSITLIRNYSSHHARLWNRRFKHTIEKSDIFADKNLYQKPDQFYFFALTIDFVLKKILPNSNWLEKLDDLIYKCLDETKNTSNEFIFEQIGKVLDSDPIA